MKPKEGKQLRRDKHFFDFSVVLIRELRSFYPEIFPVSFFHSAVFPCMHSYPYESWSSDGIAESVEVSRLLIFSVIFSIRCGMYMEKVVVFLRASLLSPVT